MSCCLKVFSFCENYKIKHHNKSYLLGFNVVPSPGSGTFFLSIRDIPSWSDAVVCVAEFSFSPLFTTLVTVVILGPPLACRVTVVVRLYLTPPPLWMALAGGTKLWLGRGVLVTWAPVWTAVGLLTGCETGPFWNGRDSRTLRCDLFDKSLKKKGTRQIVLQKTKTKL